MLHLEGHQVQAKNGVNTVAGPLHRGEFIDKNMAILKSIVVADRSHFKNKFYIANSYTFFSPYNSLLISFK